MKVVNNDGGVVKFIDMSATAYGDAGAYFDKIVEVKFLQIHY